MEGKNILVTGGAGFIGSNIVKALLNIDNVSKVIVLDNLSTGYIENIDTFFGNSKFKFIKGDIRNYETCLEAVNGIDVICHQAALGSVPRSINNPILTNEVNIVGTLNVFTAAKDASIKRIIYAASSSTYGDSLSLPKVEDVIGKPLSPYAITKYVNELYADVYNKIYGIDFIGLRYFNVFGPNQSPRGAYAAVIPLFINSLFNKMAPVINGDGLQSRDFTYVDNAVQANIKAIFCENSLAWNQVYNIAAGEQISVLDMWNILQDISKIKLEPIFGPDRTGDIKHSLANISKAKTFLNYQPNVFIKDGLERTFNWIASNQNLNVKEHN